jgi:hypothetical protein
MKILLEINMGLLYTILSRIGSPPQKFHNFPCGCRLPFSLPSCKIRERSFVSKEARKHGMVGIYDQHRCGEY